MALAKPDGGIRPIAIGCTLRRLAGKICMRRIKDKCAALFHPCQLGVGTPLGAEIAIHGCRRYMRLNYNSNKVVLKVDFSNAFNSVKRDKILQGVQKHSPELFPFVHQAYSKPSVLQFGDNKLLSMEGAQQGDPMGPYLFSLATMDLSKSCQSELNLWYLDDGTLAGDIETVLDDYTRIIAEENSLGLRLNPGKCELIVLNEDQHEAEKILDKFRSVTPEIKLIQQANMSLLGSPIQETATSNILNDKLKELNILATRLQELDAHDALFLLKNCFFIPKLLYILRTAPCYDSDVLKDFDSTIRSALQNILNVVMDDNTWAQCSLPVAMGGLGVRSASDLSLPAFISSGYACKSATQNILSSVSTPGEYEPLEVAKAKWLGEMNHDSDVPLILSDQKLRTVTLTVLRTMKFE